MPCPVTALRSSAGYSVSTPLAGASIRPSAMVDQKLSAVSAPVSQV